MQNTYWTLFALGLLGMLFSFLLLVILSILSAKGRLSKKYFLVATIFLILAILLSIYLIIPCIKDYKFISNGTFLEDEATVVEFTHVRDDPDGNGQTQYSQPKFYIESKDEYIVLYVSNVEIGRKYRIRYLPNTRICEVICCVE
ncbi:MAG: hypothetical protein IKY29_02175 [Clostridia bacterium]|nr:hypothetical protein [Clostridia bacterium]